MPIFHRPVDSGLRLGNQPVDERLGVHAVGGQDVGQAGTRPQLFPYRRWLKTCLFGCRSHDSARKDSLNAMRAVGTEWQLGVNRARDNLFQIAQQPVGALLSDPPCGHRFVNALGCCRDRSIDNGLHAAAVCGDHFSQRQALA
jgi:hypothetical protein